MPLKIRTPDFCHLHLHTEYSTLDGFGHVEQYAKRAAKLGYKYLACTDHGNIDGLIKFQKACEQYDVIPIFGCEIYIIPKLEKTRKSGHMLLLVKNRVGFKNLCKLLSYANQKGFYYKPRITYKMLLANCRGLVISSACAQSYVNMPGGEQLLEQLIAKLDEDVYLEVMPHNIPIQHKQNKYVKQLAQKYNRQIILTNDCHYVNRTDTTAQEVLLAIQRKAKWDDPKRFKFELKGLELKSKPKMLRALQECSSITSRAYLANTLGVAEKCSQFRIAKRKVKLPSPKKEQYSEIDKLKNVCLKNFKRMFGKPITKMPTYQKRFDAEVKLIKEKDFTRYFLIVHDFINYCRSADILIGPGRGSVGCSLVAYLMRITIIDPIYWNLPLDRFINADRVDYPDIDIDIEDSKRNAAVDYLVKKYGMSKVAGISTFGRLKSRAAVQDVARVFDVPKYEVDAFTKNIDQKSENGLQQVLESPEGIAFKTKYPKVIKLALKLEGQIRNKSQHAAGIVINNRALAGSGKCNLIERKNVVMVNWEKDDTEYMGLMKLDILSLKFLSILGESKKLIKQNHKKNINFENIKLNDAAVLDQISQGNTAGLFQLNPYATTKVLTDMGVSDFKDIVAATALARPGPNNSGMTDEYIKRKNGKRWEKKHATYESITADTFGMFVYQEQMMAAINKIAGLPYSTADNIRKIIGKKRNPKEFAKYKKQFLRGCKKVGIFTASEAKDFWTGLQEWAKYGFNLAHSIEYGMLGYWSGWLKHYYPTEFICANLTYGAKEKKKEIVEEAYKLDLKVILPMVNGPTHPTQWIAKDNKLYVPFNEVKGIGDKKALVAKGQPKQSGEQLLFNFKSPAQYEHTAKFKEKLQSINAYRTKEYTKTTAVMKEQFDFRITASPKDEYRNLYELFDDEIPLRELDHLLTGKYKTLRKYCKGKRLFRQVKQKRFKQLRNKILSCKKCELHTECTRPVPMTIGFANISNIAEAPGFNEDQQGEGLVGKAGNHLWQQMAKYNLYRSMFHISNLNKCYPSLTGTPKQTHMDACKVHLQKELARVRPIVILVMGRNCRYFFTGEKSGIVAASGTTTWNEQYACWLCWTVHPSAALRNPTEMEPLFQKGVKNFYKTLLALGFKKWYNNA